MALPHCGIALFAMYGLRCLAQTTKAEGDIHLILRSDVACHPKTGIHARIPRMDSRWHGNDGVERVGPTLGSACGIMTLKAGASPGPTETGGQGTKMDSRFHGNDDIAKGGASRTEKA